MKERLHKNITLEIIFWIFLVLKVFNVIELSWLEVWSPLIVYIICETINIIFDWLIEYKKSQKGELKK